jgi:trimeric autotransporter adhesin
MASTGVAPIAAGVAAGAGIAAVYAVASAPSAKASEAGPVLVLLQNGETTAPETTVLQNAGYSVTQVTPSTWEGMSTTAFEAYAALVIGDPSSGGTCSSLTPTTGTSGGDALGTNWQGAVSGNVAVLGTAPSAADTSAADALITDAVNYAAAGYSSSGSTGTGLYESLNCEYSSAAAGTAVPLLNGVEGIGAAGGLTVQGGLSCSDAGTVNTWEATAAGTFGGFASRLLSTGGWPSPACPVEEAFDRWPAEFTPVGYDAGSDVTANFTASDGAAGQPYLLLGAPVSAATQALAPSAGGEVPAGTTAGGANPADPGATQATAGDPVNTENGDFTQSNTDLSIPGFGPSLDFTRSYDAQQAEQQTETGAPGAMGYGWTDDWATSLATGKPVPGDIYALDGSASDLGDGGPAASAPADAPAGVFIPAGSSNVYIADTLNNRIQEIAGSTGTQWGISMTAGDVYTIAGSATGTSGSSGDGGAATSALLDQPRAVTMDSSGNVYIADTDNNRIQEIPAASGTQRGESMTADDIYTIAGQANGNSGSAGDGGAATSAYLFNPVGITVDSSGDLYIADSANNRIQEVAGKTAGSKTANDIYTVAGSSSGASGHSGDGSAATSALLDFPQGVSLDTAGDVYIADTDNSRIQEVPAAAGTQWGQSMTAADMYTVAGSASGTSGASGDGGPATSALLNYPTSVLAGNGGQLYVADSFNNRVQEVARTAHTEFGQSMTANDVYTVAGNAAGNSGYSGDGGAATSALMDYPLQAVLDASGDLVIADTLNNRIREVSASTADISTIAGTGGTLSSVGNEGPAISAAISHAQGVAADASGNIYIADTGNSRIQEIAATSHTQWGIPMTAGDVYTVAGSATGNAGTSGDGGSATSALLNHPAGVAVDAQGDLYIADSYNSRIQEVPAATGTWWGQSMTAGDIYTIAGNAAGNGGDSGNGGPATSALLNTPADVAVDPAGDVYIADTYNNRIQEVPAASGTHWGQSMTAGDIYTVAGSSSGASGTSGDDDPAASALLNTPAGVAVDASGNVYIADGGNNRVQEMAAATGPHFGQQMTAGDIYTIAGSAAGTYGGSGDGGPATAALLSSPQSVAVDSSGDVYLTDTYNNRVQEIAAASGTQWAQSMTAGDIYTVTGPASWNEGSSGNGGPATSALMNNPDGLAADLSGNLYVSDTGNNQVREVNATSIPVFPEAPATGAVTVTEPGGAQVTFQPQSGGSCTAPYVKGGSYCAMPQVLATLTYNSGPNDYTFTPTPGTTYTYGPGGTLNSESDAAGDTLTAAYGTPSPGSGNCPAAASYCDTITAASGRALVIGYNASNLVTSVTDPMGRTWAYGYTADDLTTVTDPLGNKTTYTYGAGSTGNPLLANDLLTITTPNAQPSGPDAGKSTVNVYNAVGQVTSQTDPMGFTTTFNFTGMNVATGTGLVKVADPDGNADVYDYIQGALAATSYWTGTTLTSEQDDTPDTTASNTANPSGGTLLDTTSTNGDGNTTSYTYNPGGNTTSVTAPDGVGSQTGTTSAQYTVLDSDSCSATAETSTPCSSSETGPSPVAPGGVITPPSSAPPAGETWTLYDTDGNKLYSTTGVYEPASNTASYSQTTYQLFNGNSVTLNGNNMTCTNTSPSQSLPCATINADGVVTQLQYDAQGDLTSSSTPDGNGSQLASTTYTYDSDGEQTSATSPDGNVSGSNAGNYTTVSAYNSDGQKTSVTKAGGSGATVTPRTTHYGYDANGNQTTLEDARGYVTTTAYNADNKATLVTNPDGDATLTCYDGDGNVAQTVPAVGVAANSLTAASCPASYPSGYTDRLASDAAASTFNALGKQTQQTTPAPAGQSGYETTIYSYDASGNLLSTTAPATSNGGANEVIADTYNAAGKLASQTTGYGTSAASTISYCYDPDGDETALVYADGNTSAVASCETSSPWLVSSSSYPTQAAYQTTYSYDSAGELVSTTTPATSAAPSGATTTSTYDPVGNTLTSTDSDGVTTTWTYTPLNLTASISYSGSSAHSVSYTYDPSGNKTGMTDATGTSSYVYDPFSELTSATNGAGQVTGYGYNADGKVTSITYPLPATATWTTTDTVSYGYDNADLLTSVTDFNGHQISITNTADGLPSTQTLGATGDTITTTYDPTDTSSVISLKTSSSTLQSFTYSDAPGGDVLSETDTPSSSLSPADYTYDAQGRVTSMTPGTGSANDYGFDASSNLTILPTGATGTYNDAGELTSSSLSGTTTNYSYNADGEQLKATQGSTTVASAAWNGAAQLTTYDNSAADMTAATYDGNGMRASSTTTPTGGSAITQNYVWDTIPQEPQLIMDSTNAYIYGAGNTPAEQVNVSTGVVTYLVADSLGSVRGIINSTGALTATTSYDSWGNPETTGGLTAYSPFGYAGAYTDPDGLLYLVDRYYDSSTGQFLSVDPLLTATRQPYLYGNGNPVRNTDPHGTSACGWTSYGGWTIDGWGVPAGLFGGCVDGIGLYVWGRSAGFVGWSSVCGWNYSWHSYWSGRLQTTWNGPYHRGCNWNNNGNYDFTWYMWYWYPRSGPFDAQLWATDANDRRYLLAEVSFWVW